MNPKINLVVRALFFAGCLIAICYGNRPGAAAEESPRLSATDAVQNHEIEALNDHLRSTDAMVEQHRIQINSNSLAIAEGQGEQRAFFLVLGLLSTVSIVIQVRGKKA